MKQYKYDEWDFEWEEGKEFGDFADRIYLDKNGNKITGTLEGFYCFGDTAGPSDSKNCRYVENGKVK